MKSTTKKILILMVTTLAVLVLTACNPALPLNPRYAYTNIEMNLGDEVDASIEEFIDFSQLSKDERDFVKENTKIFVDDKEVTGNKVIMKGKHSIDIEYCGHLYRSYTIKVVDREAPVFTKAENLYTFVGLNVDYATTNLMFEAEDNSNYCGITVDDSNFDCQKPGTYKVEAIATDPSGNQSKASANIVVQEPEYGAKGTYVYVSIPDQTLTYFVNSKVDFSTPIVSGNTNGHNTPTGTFRVNNKARNITLKGFEDNGDEYESFVNYWMAFLGYSYGLHDATWRSYFGGQIYMGGGSHGCVNMPLDMAASLYEKIAIGTPVLIY